MNVVEARKLRKEYGGLVAVADVDLTIEKGDVVGLIGPNGAGKTTLLKMLATLLRPTSGDMIVMGKPVRDEPEAVRAQLGYMPDFFNLYPGLSLDECVRFFGRAYGVPENRLEQRVAESLDYVGLGEKRYEVISHLSRGMTQRLGVANLLVHDPPFIILDEPASGLDPAARIQLRQVLRRLASEGKTILISSHILTELEEMCTHVCAMHRGKVMAQGRIDQIRSELTSAVITVHFVWPDGGKAAGLEEAARISRSVSGVLEVRFLQEGISVTLSPDKAAHAALNNALVSARLPVCSFSQEKQGLEALFMEITGKATHGEPPVTLEEDA